MSEAAAATSSADPLRLAFCPNCDYSLQGLADGVACPECGMRCDSSFVILQDDVGEETEPAGRKRRRWFVFAVIALLLLYMLYRGFGRARAHALVWFLPAIAVWSFVSWNRLLAVRASHMQMWMHEMGFELLQSTEEARRANRLIRVVNVLIMPLMMITAAFSSRNADMRWIMVGTGLVAATGSGVISYICRKKNPTTVVRCGDFVRHLIPWVSVDRCEVTQPADDRIKIRFRRPIYLVRSFKHSDPWISIHAPCDPARFHALCDRLNSWRGIDGWTVKT